MRVAHLIRSVDNAATGPSNSVRGLCHALEPEGVEVDLLTLEWERATVDDKFLRRFPIGFGPRKLGLSPAMRAWLMTQAHLFPNLIMHSHNIWMLTSYYPYLVRRRNPSTRYVCSPHAALSAYSLSTGSRAKPIYWALVQERILNDADCLHATSEAECDDIRRLGLRAPVAIIPNGVALPTEDHRPSDDQRTVLYLGRMHPEKGLVNLLHAWGLVESELAGWRLRLVGPDPVGHRHELEALAHELRLRQVNFEEAAVGESKWLAMERAEVFILPSPSENFGLVVAEALSAGVPVIATNGTPWSAVVDHGAGWYCGTAIADLADALRRAAATHFIERRLMGQRGREWMRASYGWDGIAEKMAITYRWLLQGGIAPSWIDGRSRNG